MQTLEASDRKPGHMTMLWGEQVQTKSDLPDKDHPEGECRLVFDEDQVYVWHGGEWCRLMLPTAPVERPGQVGGPTYTTGTLPGRSVGQA